MSSAIQFPQTITPDIEKVSTFVPDGWQEPDIQAVVPIPKDWVWDSLSNIQQCLGTGKPLVHALPSIWQCQQFCYRTARSYQIPVAYIPTPQPELIAAVLNETGAGVITTTADMLPALIDYISKTKYTPDAVLVVHHKADTIRSYEVRYPIIHEIHILPGIPLFTQTISQALQQKTNEFVCTPLFTVTEDNIAQTTVRANIGDYVTIQNYTLPFSISINEDGTYNLT